MQFVALLRMIHRNVLAISASSFLWTLAAGEECYANSRFIKADWPVCNVISSEKTVYSKVSGKNVLLGFHASEHMDGWSALAFAGNGGMKGAHEIVVRMVDGSWVAEDRHSNDYVTPSLDAKQDVKLIWADQSAASGTSWAVALPKESCDPNDYAVEDRNVYFLWALGSSHSFTYHATQRGQFHANLFREPVPLPSLTDALEFDVKMPNVDVVLGPGGQDPVNPYICGIFDLRKLTPGRDYTNSKVHIGKMSALLHGPSEEYVHHIILYSCNEEAAAGFTHNSLIEECESMPPGCNEMVWPWAKGALPVVFPSDVGFPVGDGNHWLAMQMHYYNPSQKTGIKDSSGVKLFALPSLRATDAGYIQLNGGTSEGMRDPLPSGQSEVTLSSFVVPKDCTSGWDASGITLLGTTHHMHLLGTKMTIDVSRDEQYVGTLRKENHYDFNHQSLEESTTTKLMPGDEISVKCTYDTSSASNPVPFGDLTQYEMCYSVLLYYPAQKVNNFLHIKPKASLDAASAASLVDSCTKAGSDAYTDVSACAQTYGEYPVNFFGYAADPTPYPAISMCNIGFPLASNPAVIEYTPDEIMGFNPAACPPCYKTSSCTQDDIKVHAQAVCKPYCGSFGLSVYPDVSSTTPVPQSHTTVCGGNSIDFTPDETVFQAPECQYVGELDSVMPSPPPAVAAPPSSALSKGFPQAAACSALHTALFSTVAFFAAAVLV